MVRFDNSLVCKKLNPAAVNSAWRERDPQRAIWASLALFPVRKPALHLGNILPEKLNNRRFRHCLSTSWRQKLRGIACPAMQSGPFGDGDHDPTVGNNGRLVPGYCDTGFGSRVD